MIPVYGSLITIIVCMTVPPLIDRMNNRNVQWNWKRAAAAYGVITLFVLVVPVITSAEQYILLILLVIAVAVSALIGPLTYLGTSIVLLLSTVVLPIINFRIGIDMGQVLIGKIGINNHNFLSAIGTAANLASKVQALALSNGICIGNGLARNLHPYLYTFCEVGVHPEWTWRYGDNGPPYNFYHFNHDWPDPAEWIRGGFFRQPVM